MHTVSIHIDGQRLVRPLLGGSAAAILASCGSYAVSPERSGAPAAVPAAAHATATATAPPRVAPPATVASTAPPVVSRSTAVLVTEEHVTRNQAAVTIVHFSDVSGRALRSVELPSGEYGDVFAANALYFVHGSKLDRVGADGAIAAVGVLDSNSGDIVEVSPDGTRWLWSSLTLGKDGAFDEQVLVAGTHTPRHVVDELRFDPSQHGATPATLMPLGWDSVGPIVERSQMGSCGGGPGAFGLDTHTLAHVDTQTGALTSFGTRITGAFAGTSPALAAYVDEGDGSPGAPARPVTVRVARGDDVVHWFTLPRTLTAAASAVFDSTSAHLAITVGSGSDDQSRNRTARVDVVDLRTGERHLVGGAGYYPRALLDDGTVVAEQTAPAGGMPGLVTMDAAGGMTPLVGDQFVGVVAA